MAKTDNNAKRFTPPRVGVDERRDGNIRQTRIHVEFNEQHVLEYRTGRHRYYYETINGRVCIKWYRIFMDESESRLIYEEERLYDLNATNQIGTRMKWFDPSTRRVLRQKTITITYTTQFDSGGNQLYWDVSENEVTR